MEQLTKMMQNGDWLNSHYSQLAEKYPNKFVAIYDGKVVGSGSDAEALIASLKRDKVDLDCTLIEYMYEKGVEVIL